MLRLLAAGFIVCLSSLCLLVVSGIAITAFGKTELVALSFIVCMDYPYSSCWCHCDCDTIHHGHLRFYFALLTNWVCAERKEFTLRSEKILSL